MERSVRTSKENRKVVYIRVSENVHAWLTETAYIQDRSISAVARQIFEGLMEAEENYDESGTLPSDSYSEIQS